MKTSTQSQNQQEELVTVFLQVIRKIRKRMNVTDPDLLNPYQLHALFTLARHAGTMSELAEELSISHPSATSLVDRLVRHDWVERRPDPEDRRIIRLSLTDSGKKLLIKKKHERMRQLKGVLEVLPKEDIASLHRIFSKLRDSLENK